MSGQLGPATNSFHAFTVMHDNFLFGTLIATGPGVGAVPGTNVAPMRAAWSWVTSRDDFPEEFTLDHVQRATAQMGTGAWLFKEGPFPATAEPQDVTGFAVHAISPMPQGPVIGHLLNRRDTLGVRHQVWTSSEQYLDPTRRFASWERLHFRRVDNAALGMARTVTTLVGG